MLFFRVDAGGNVTEVLTEKDADRHGNDIIARHEMKEFADAMRIAEQANALTDSKLCGKHYLPCDNGSHVHPRYDVVLSPRVGEPVSYAFNGDYYPDGYIVKVGGTNCSRVYTDKGSVYNRRRKSGSWVKRGGTWSMVRGHIDERNPSF